MDIIMEQFRLGPMQNFLYFLGDPAGKTVAIVDPAWDVDTIRQKADDKGYMIESIFLTHGHMDHVNGIADLQKTHDIPVYLSDKEADLYTPECKNLTRVRDHEILKVGNVSFEIIHTPGHTPGCQCFRNENIFITGDTLFVDGCGRCDLPEGDPEAMYHSLHDIILKLPGALTIYPGHDYGPKSFDTLANQKKTNPYLCTSSKEQFLHQRMGV
jgi:hydroxyacylglutathione hydrolase